MLTFASRAGNLIIPSPGTDLQVYVGVRGGVFAADQPTITLVSRSEQGDIGSCEAQSFGYGLGSYTAARRADGSIRWVAELPENSVSPAYLFAWATFRGSDIPTDTPITRSRLRSSANINPSRARIEYCRRRIFE